MFNISPASLITNYLPASGRTPTNAMWRKLASQMYSGDGSVGFTMYDDFRAFGKSTAVASNIGRYVSSGNQYYSFEDTGDSITQLATEPTGVVKLLTDTTDNDECALQLGDATSVAGLISDTAGADKLLIFEARVKMASITDTKMNMFVGLAEEGAAVNSWHADSGGVLEDKDYIGFQVLETDGDALLFTYKKAGQTKVNVFTYGTALAADTFYKLGFIYDPQADPTQRIKAYVDGVEQSTYITKTNIETATFPDGEELSPIFSMKNAAGEAMSASMDWWAFHQAL
jgi:hypothetical protein